MDMEKIIEQLSSGIVDVPRIKDILLGKATYIQSPETLFKRTFLAHKQLKADLPLGEIVCFWKLVEYLFNQVSDSGTKQCLQHLFLDEMKTLPGQKYTPYTLGSIYPEYQQSVSRIINKLLKPDPIDDVFDIESIAAIAHQLSFLSLISPNNVIRSLVTKMYNNPSVSKQIVLLLKILEPVTSFRYSEFEEPPNLRTNPHFSLIMYQLKRFNNSASRDKMSLNVTSSDGSLSFTNMIRRLCCDYFVGTTSKDRVEALMDVNEVIEVILIPMTYSYQTLGTAMNVLLELCKAEREGLVKIKLRQTTIEFNGYKETSIENILVLLIHHLPALITSGTTESIWTMIRLLRAISQMATEENFTFSLPIINHQFTKLKRMDWKTCYVVTKIFREHWGVDRLIIPKGVYVSLSEECLPKFKYLQTDRPEDKTTSLIDAYFGLAALCVDEALEFLKSNNFKIGNDSNLLMAALARGLINVFEMSRSLPKNKIPELLITFARKFNVLCLPSKGNLNYLCLANADMTKDRRDPGEFAFVASVYFHAFQLADPNLVTPTPEPAPIKKGFRSLFLHFVCEQVEIVEKRLGEHFNVDALPPPMLTYLQMILSEADIYMCQFNLLLDMSVEKDDHVFKNAAKKFFDFWEKLAGLKGKFVQDYVLV
uniref:Nucleolar pre-ribosomal-associated protein 1 n=1 Tax=Rhabditophanes sp. KR3021 TaxID=114890 RepID=A0AC35TVK9_9BILA